MKVRMMMSDLDDLPANPMAVELTSVHRRVWHHQTRENPMPEQWEISADVEDFFPCRDFRKRHVGQFSLTIADLHREPTLLDRFDLGEWAFDFLTEAVTEPGQLHPELDEQIGAGPGRMVIVRHFELTKPWRGHGLGAALLASALYSFAPGARLAACRVSLSEMRRLAATRRAPKRASERIGAMLEGIGFRLWRDVHVVDLRNPRLYDAREDPFEDPGEHSKEKEREAHPAAAAEDEREAGALGTPD